MKLNFYKAAQNDIDDFYTNGSMPLTLLQDPKSSPTDIVSRYQTLFSDDDIKLFGKPANPKLMAKNLTPFTQDNKYTAFCFAKPSDINTMIYPLVSPLKSDIERNIPAYANLKKEFVKNFKVKVVEKDQLTYFSKIKKQSFIKSTIDLGATLLKYCVTALTFGKKKFVKTPSDKAKGKLILKSLNTATGQPYGQADKLAKMYSYVAEQTASNIYQKSKYITSNEKTIKLISSLIATQHIMLASDLGSAETTKDVYSALALQISNAFASMGTLSQNDKKTIVSLATQTTQSMLTKLNKSEHTIIDNLNLIGFKMQADEQSSVEEIIFAKQYTETKQKETITKPKLKDTEQTENQTFSVILERTQSKPVIDTQKISVQPVITDKKTTTLSRKTVKENFDTLVCKSFAEMVEKYNEKLSSPVITDKTKTKITNQRNFLQLVLNHFDIASYNFAVRSLETIKKEAVEGGIKTAEDYAKMFAVKIVEKRDKVLDTYFDDKSLKEDKVKETTAICGNLTTSSFLNKIFIREFKSTKQASTLKTQMKDYVLYYINLALEKFKKQEKAAKQNQKTL